MTAVLRALSSLERLGAASSAAVAAECGWQPAAARSVLEHLRDTGLVNVEKRFECRLWRLK